MKILFICKHNRFRSKVAEAIFNKLNKNSKYKSESAGIIIDELRPYVAENVKKIMNEYGYNISGKPRQISSKKIDNYDLLVIVANNVSTEFFKDDFKGKIIKWNINDCSEDDINRIRETVEKIEEKVKEFVKGL